MIDIRKLKELVKLMVENDLVELDLRDENETVTLKRPNPGGGVVMMPQHAAAPQYHPAPAGSHAPGAGASGAQPPDGDDDDGLVPIVSPMVGTFYSAPDPESPPYASVGGRVSPGSVVCIVEAMKVFSEIKSEVSGTVEKVLVKNAEPVEFGQTLYLVRPD
ncbi:MAG: acetyl-CoA carboxylase biotin carboxyl carrier protein [Phycisphaerales bacterium]